ncbi:hypothetical protein [Paenibacillus sp. MMO-58]|uniref:hypothetical protein n=1 Tax=Paenibacillus sp. MMO-58 TaxID=3081290 RepID=UPI0030198C0D
MKAPRDRISIEEVLSTEPELIEKITEFHDASAGEFFFMKDAPDKVHYITEEVYDEAEGFWKVRNENEEIIDYYGNAVPLFSSTAMMDIIRQHCRLEVRSFKGGWLVILEGSELMQSEEGDDLVSLLWKVMKKVHLDYPI